MNIPKPQKRSSLRKMLGREYFILRRKLRWMFSGTVFASLENHRQLPYAISEHKSLLLRPLKDVEMYLQHNKVTNLRLAMENISGVIIKPGETFSFWHLVGRPTAVKGYREGLTLDNGSVSKGIGGGLCQFGNLLYWMALHSPLTIVERWRHGFDVFPDVNRTIPFACGATLSYNYIDLQLQNNTHSSFQITIWLDEEYLYGSLTSDDLPEVHYDIYETDHRIVMQSWGGYTRHNKIWKKTVNRIDSTTSEELVAVNHAIMMYNPLLKE